MNQIFFKKGYYVRLSDELYKEMLYLQKRLARSDTEFTMQNYIRSALIKQNREVCKELGLHKQMIPYKDGVYMVFKKDHKIIKKIRS